VKKAKTPVAIATAASVIVVMPQSAISDLHCNQRRRRDIFVVPSPRKNKLRQERHIPDVAPTELNSFWDFLLQVCRAYGAFNLPNAFRNLARQTFFSASSCIHGI